MKVEKTMGQFEKIKDKVLKIYIEVDSLVWRLTNGELGHIKITSEASQTLWHPFLIVKKVSDERRSYTEEEIISLSAALKKSIQQLKELVSSYQLITLDKQLNYFKRQFQEELKNLENRILSEKEFLSVLKQQEEAPAPEATEIWEDIQKKNLQAWKLILETFGLSNTDLNGLGRTKIWHQLREAYRNLYKNAGEDGQMILNEALNQARLLLTGLGIKNLLKIAHKSK